MTLRTIDRTTTTRGSSTSPPTGTSASTARRMTDALRASRRGRLPVAAMRLLSHPPAAALAWAVLATLAVATVFTGCDDGEGWTYRGVPESEWRGLASAGGEASAEASRILLLMDRQDCRDAFDALRADLDAEDGATRRAALDAIAAEDAFRRWFPEEVRTTLEDRAIAWNAPVGDPRHERWSQWIGDLPRAQQSEGRALVRALAADPNTALGMAGPRRLDRVLGESTISMASPATAPRAMR